MSTYLCDPSLADKVGGLTPSTCHTQIYKIEEDTEKRSIRVHFDVLQSTDKENVHKSGMFTLFAIKNDGTDSAAFHRNLRDITIATGLATKETFDQYKVAKQTIPLNPHDWVGMQLVIVLEPQRSNPQYTQPKSFLNVHDPKVAKMCLDEQMMEVIDKQLANGVRPALTLQHDEDGGYMN